MLVGLVQVPIIEADYSKSNQTSTTPFRHWEVLLLAVLVLLSSRTYLHQTSCTSRVDLNLHRAVSKASAAWSRSPCSSSSKLAVKEVNRYLSKQMLLLTLLYYFSMQTSLLF